MKTLFIMIAFAAVLSAQAETKHHMEPKMAPDLRIDAVGVYDHYDKDVRFAEIAVDKPAMVQPQRYWDLTVGPELSLLAGMSYQNPGVGGFGRLHGAINRFEIFSTMEASRDRKVYEKDGLFLGNVSEIGYRFGRVTPEVVMYFGRQINSQYTKAMLSFGGGARFDVAPGVSMYGQYLAPDRLSFNHTQRGLFGVDADLPHRLFLGVSCAMIIFDQPLLGGKIPKYTGMELQARFGFRLFASRER